MTKKAYIKAVDYYLPENILTNDQIAERFPEWTAKKVASKVGISERHLSAPDETAADMAYQAAENFSFKRQSCAILLISLFFVHKVWITNFHHHPAFYRIDLDSRLLVVHLISTSVAQVMNTDLPLLKDS